MFESSYNDSFLAATALDAVDDAVVADNCRPHWAQTAEKRMTDRLERCSTGPPGDITRAVARPVPAKPTAASASTPEAVRDI